ncbi:MAG: NERD domain-containing serine/threonine-protein kinase, partial [Elusimicrobiales bacterium]|nr:NERD domain-containing serine/threonine-protein kinase [Elusimicrobiales bacterium]
MKITIIPFASPVNESEKKAFYFLENKIKGISEDAECFLLTNVMFSVNDQLQSEEIDAILVSERGVKIIEIKHWNSQWINSNSEIVEKEADLLTFKARKIGTTLKNQIKQLPYVEGVILLTQEPSKLKDLKKRLVRGVNIYTFNEWQKLIDLDSPKTISLQQVKNLCKFLVPKSSVTIDGSLKKFGNYINLELQSPKDERFHRIYKGIHSIKRYKVILHLFDLSVSDDKSAENKARREFDVLHKLQQFPWVPRILDSFQPAPGYFGEMFFFSYLDPAAPTLKQRISDISWGIKDRIIFTKNTLEALEALHNIDKDEKIVHRNLNTNTILVKFDNTPIFTGFYRAKIPSDVTVTSKEAIDIEKDPTIAPEIFINGWKAADQRSDIYSVCVSLSELFSQFDDPKSKEMIE